MDTKQPQKAEGQPDGKRDEEMIGGVRSYNQFSGHEGVDAALELDPDDLGPFKSKGYPIIELENWQ